MKIVFRFAFEELMSKIQKIILQSFNRTFQDFIFQRVMKVIVLLSKNYFDDCNQNNKKNNSAILSINAISTG